MAATGLVHIPGRNHLVGRIISRRTYRPRSCDNCSGTYYRCNKFEAWIQQNVGHSTGWRKVLMRLCIKCQDAPRSMKSLLVVEAHISRAPYTSNGQQERRRA